MSSCWTGCPLGERCRFAPLCLQKLPAGELTEADLGHYLRLSLAGGGVAHGALTGLWPFAPGMSVLRLRPVAGPASIHLVADAVEVHLT